MSEAENTGQPAAAPDAAVAAAVAPAPVAAPSPFPAAPAAPAPAAAAPVAAPAVPSAPAAVAPSVEQSWRETIADKKLREYADRYASPTDLVSAALKMRDDVSSRIRVPDENSPPEEVAKYRKALGVPDAPDGYKITLPENIALNDIDKAMIEAVKPIALESGIPAPALNNLVSKFMELSNNLSAQVAAQSAEQAKVHETQLRQEWGAEFDANLNVARRVASAMGPDFTKFLNETSLENGGMLGDHPVMAKILATFGHRMGEGDVHIGSTPHERTSVKAEIDQLNAAVPVGSREYTNAAHQAKLQALYEKLHGRNPVIDGQQRVA